MGCATATAAAPPFSTIPCEKTRSFAFADKTHQNPPKTRQKSHLFQLSYSLNNNFSNPQYTRKSAISQSLILFTFSFTLLILRLTSGLLLPDFSHRWRQLLGFSSQAEAELIQAPEYLFQAVVAYEDRRFFSHFGVDPVGLARAVLSLSARGGGSTITQQIYWGHGIYGIKYASNFYLGKHPSLLSLCECALLVGMIPAPELRSPFRDYSRGKTFQARVLKRMVDGHFLDIETALSAMRKSVLLKSDGLGDAENLLLPMSSFRKGLTMPIMLERGMFSSMKDIWDWERESTIREVREEMERWATSIRKT